MQRIEHVVVLMLENRSFDNVLGQLYPKSEQFDGIDLTETNPWHKPDGTVEKVRTWTSDGPRAPLFRTSTRASCSTISACTFSVWAAPREAARP